ncbi:hypothetical protein B0H16DRAFT_1447164 [Mycena metata]|uniref:Uncharacterized protein n=1 Tax=Mycena metata TaxID=1033252 RepID=A0AAD7KE71_9AGAR|nr:hypothetical protein B0H16DRAFT_1447164 [Mycena metata]
MQKLSLLKLVTAKKLFALKHRLARKLANWPMQHSSTPQHLLNSNFQNIAHFSRPLRFVPDQRKQEISNFIHATRVPSPPPRRVSLVFSSPRHFTSGSYARRLASGRLASGRSLLPLASTLASTLRLDVNGWNGELSNTSDVPESRWAGICITAASLVQPLLETLQQNFLCARLRFLFRLDTARQFAGVAVATRELPERGIWVASGARLVDLTVNLNWSDRERVGGRDQGTIVLDVGENRRRAIGNKCHDGVGGGNRAAGKVQAIVRRASIGTRWPLATVVKVFPKRATPPSERLVVVVGHGLCASALQASSQFTFVWTTPLLGASAQAPTPAVPNPTFYFSTFHGNLPNPTPHAIAQAQYRARNPEAERSRARERMRRLRDSRQARAISSERLRATPEFACYKAHVERHRGAVYGYSSDPVYRAAFDRFRLKDSPVEFEREDAIFVLQHATPQPTTELSEEEITSCLAQLKRCTLILELDLNDPHDAAGYAELQQHAGQTLTDADLEFMFRHAVPQPTMGNMEACGCV